MMKNLTLWNPNRRLAAFHDDFDNVFGRLFGEGPFGGPFASVNPALETFRRDGAIVVRADLPGMEPKEIDVSVEDGRLTIRGERKHVDEGPENASYREVSYGSFERTVLLPKGVDVDALKASYENGVLEIKVPVSEDQVPKKIPVAVH